MNNNEKAKHEAIRSESDNNGWIRINSEDDLPKKDGYYWVIDEEGDRWVTYYINDGRSFLLDQTEYGELNPLPLNPHHFTHYKPVPDPGRPVY